MSSNKEKLIANFSALTIIQGVNYILPLVVLPYLVRIIGPERFGILAFAQAVVFYFTLIPDLGTNLYAPREIAIIKDDKPAISNLVSAILSLKIILLLAGMLLYMLTVATIPKFREEYLVFLFSSLYMIANTLMPVWFFQGIEKMFNITVSMLLARLLSLVFIFIIVKDAGDYIYVPIINAGGTLAGGLFLLIRMFGYEGVCFCKTKLSFKKKILNDSMPLFISNIAISIYTGINTVVLGFLTSNTIVGYYSAAEKLIKAGMGLQAQLSNVFYPHTSRKLSISKEEGIQSMRVGFIITMLFAIPAAFFVVIFGSPIIQIMFGGEFYQSVLPLKIMGMLFLVIGLSNVFGIQILLPMGKGKTLMKVTIAAGLFNLVLIFALTPGLKEIGASIAFLLSELLVTFSLYLAIKHMSLGLFSKQVLLKLIVLVISLTSFFVLTLLIDINFYIVMTVFLLLYLILVIALKFVDLRTLSIRV